MKVNKKRAYFAINKIKKDKFGIYDPNSLNKGILMSVTTNNRSVTAYREITRILIHNFQKKELEAQDDLNNGALSLEEQIEIESREIMQEEKRFTFIDNISRCLVLIKFNDSSDIPSIMVEELMKNMYNNLNSQVENIDSECLLSSRFVNRLIPLDIICPAKINEIEYNLQTLIDSNFRKSSRILDNDQNNEESISWACFYSSRCSGSDIKRQDIYDLVTKLIWGVLDDPKYIKMKNKYPVHLGNPDKAIIVEITRSFCGMSILNNYFKYCKYNLNKLNNRSILSDELKTNIVVGNKKIKV